MAGVKQLVSTAILKEGLKYIEKEPMKNMPKLLKWAEKIVTRENHKQWLESFKEIADLTQVSINTALGRMRYGLINLRKMMTEKQICL